MPLLERDNRYGMNVSDGNADCFVVRFLERRFDLPFPII